MEQLGKVGEWNDERGFGFIVPLEGTPARVFFHVRDYRLDGRRPETGELVKFAAQRQPDGRWRASGVRRAAAPTRSSPRPAPSRRSASSASPKSIRLPAWPGWLLVLAYATGIGWAIHAGRLPFEAALVAPALSAAAFTAYALDKHAAQTGRWRIPESTLHALELAGGWPGAWVAQRCLRHKNRKPGYQAVFWCMVLLHVAVLSAWVLKRT